MRVGWSVAWWTRPVSSFIALSTSQNVAEGSQRKREVAHDAEGNKDYFGRRYWLPEQRRLRRGRVFFFRWLYLFCFRRCIHLRHRHIFIRQYPQQVNGRSLALSQPFSVFSRIQDDRLSVVYLAHLRVRVAR